MKIKDFLLDSLNREEYFFLRKDDYFHDGDQTNQYTRYCP